MVSACTASGKTYAFVLTPDIKEALNGAIAPFAGGNCSPAVNPDGPQPSISPLLYLERDSGSASDQSRAVWLQTNLYINTTPAGLETSFNQDSFINIVAYCWAARELGFAIRAPANSSSSNFSIVLSQIRSAPFF